MATYKYVFEFTDVNGASWGEIHYSDASNITSALVVPNSLISARLNLLSSLNTFQRVRVSNTSGLRETGVIVINFPGTYDINNQNASIAPAIANYAIVLQLAGVNGGQRKLWLRGTAAGASGRSATTGLPTYSATLQKGVTDYIKALKNAAFGLRRLTPIVNPALQISNITTIDGSAKNGLSIVTAIPGLVIPVNANVIISRTRPKDFPGLNGHFAATQVSPTTFTINYVTPNNAGPIACPGKVKVENYAATSIYDPTRSGIQYLGSRDSKNPLSRSRGARRAARNRLSP